jgi:hypothetical protein
MPDFPEIDAFLPGESASAARLLEALIRAARSAGSKLDGWREYSAAVHGDLAGQRALARDPAIQRWFSHPTGDLHDFIIALQTYFVMIANLLAAARLRQTRGRAIRLPALAHDTKLPFDWYEGRLRRAGCAAMDELSASAHRLASFPLPPGHDLMQRLYQRLMPRNLLHITGEVYTPGWLAELFVRDSGWQPGQTLIDPFAGSGVFLLAALKHAKKKGVSGLDALANFAAIERNPVACAALRANLILHLAEEIAVSRRAIKLLIFCADTLLPDGAPLPGPADVLLTNPPWVGWEYIPRAYRARLDPLWKKYDLFTATGRDAAFLKEDLSTLALVLVWDRFLKDGGRSAVVLRPAAMQSHLAARGLRRLSLFANRGPLALRLVRLFAGMRVFGKVQAPSAAWTLTKGAATHFPVQVVEWQPREPGWRPGPVETVDMVRNQVNERGAASAPSESGNSASAWTIGDSCSLRAMKALTGSNAYRVRTGVFTGGANAVYYLERRRRFAGGTSRYRNVLEGSRRQAAALEFTLEDDLVYEVVRGRDIGMWRATSGALLLCPHTAETRMKPIPPKFLKLEYPHADRYLRRMRPVLDARRGFSGWERRHREAGFYALQRIGAYTFLPYKVAWRYIATDFLVSVIGPAADGRTRLGNDKVMFVACEKATEAYFLCGLLSSDPIRWCVTATMTGTQISTSAIKHLKLPPFDADDADHAAIADSCRRGHECVQKNDPGGARRYLDSINRTVARMYGLSKQEMKWLSGAKRRW